MQCFKSHFICQMYYFSLGECLSYYFRRSEQAHRKGVNIFYHNRIYMEWTDSSLMSLLEGLRGPFWLRQLSISNNALFLFGSAILGAAMALIYIMYWQGEKQHGDT